jgi:hypothetical protein
MSSSGVVLVIAIGLGGVQPVSAQSPTQSRRQPGAIARSTAGWTSIGTAAGFGVGLYIGLAAFDGALNSDRKVWTSAAVGARVGALAGHLVARTRRHDCGRAAPAIRSDGVIHPPRLDPALTRATPMFMFADPPFHLHDRIESATAAAMPFSVSNK